MSKRGRPSLDPQIEGPSPSITFRLPATLYDRVCQLSLQRDIDLTIVVRQACEDYVSRAFPDNKSIVRPGRV